MLGAMTVWNFSEAEIVRRPISCESGGGFLSENGI